MVLPPSRHYSVTLFADTLVPTRDFYITALHARVIHEDYVSVGLELGGLEVMLILRSEAQRMFPTKFVVSRPPALSFVLSMWVDDVDIFYATLRECDLESATEPADRDWGVRSFTIADPSGNLWEIQQPIELAQAWTSHS